VADEPGPDPSSTRQTDITGSQAFQVGDWNVMINIQDELVRVQPPSPETTALS
jgi:hypothetical protein